MISADAANAAALANANAFACANANANAPAHASAHAPAVASAGAIANAAALANADAIANANAGRRRGFRSLLFLIPALLLFAYPAEARRHHRQCPHGQILRVSLGQCVGARSRAAWGFQRAPGPRLHRPYKHRHRKPVQIADPDEGDMPDEVQAPVKGQDRVASSGKAAKLPVRAPEAPVEDTSLSVEGISGSILMKLPLVKSFEWLPPK
jgi:hypothetical protein